jgi:SAM-dependent methyltransferase
MMRLPTSSEINRNISPNDDMAIGDAIQWYFDVSELALKNISAVLNTPHIEKNEISKILDLPSGYGRVLRWLVKGFPDASITACETNVDAIDYSSKEFCVTGVRSNYDITQIQLPHYDYDLIWCGSLFTHFSDILWSQLLDLFHDNLRLKGVLVFTTHGRAAAQYMRQQNPIYGLDPNIAKQVLLDFDNTGFGYANYDDKYPVYGISMSSIAWVTKKIERFPDLRIYYLCETAWGHQDVFGVVKA